MAFQKSCTNSQAVNLKRRLQDFMNMTCTGEKYNEEIVVEECSSCNTTVQEG